MAEYPRFNLDEYLVNDSLLIRDVQKNLFELLELTRSPTM